MIWDVKRCHIKCAFTCSAQERVGKQSGCVCPAEEYTRRARRTRERRDIRERVYIAELIVKDWFFREKEK